MPTKKTIVVPCIVNSRLKTCGETKSLCGAINWMRIAAASSPPTRKHQEREADVQDADPLVIDVVTHDPGASYSAADAIDDARYGRSSGGIIGSVLGISGASAR